MSSLHQYPLKAVATRSSLARPLSPHFPMAPAKGRSPFTPFQIQPPLNSPFSKPGSYMVKKLLRGCSARNYRVVSRWYLVLLEIKAFFRLSHPLDFSASFSHPQQSNCVKTQRHFKPVPSHTHLTRHTLCTHQPHTNKIPMNTPVQDQRTRVFDRIILMRIHTNSCSKNSFV